MLTIFKKKSYPCYSIKITRSNLKMFLTYFFNSHILDTLLKKLLALTSECCCQATFPTKKTKKKLADHELTMTLRSEAVANVCEKTKTFVKIYSELRLFLEEGSY